MAVQISEHLLRSRDPWVNEEDHGDGLVAELWSFLQGALNGGSAVLSIVDDEASRQGDLQDAKVSLVVAAKGLEVGIDIDRGGQR